MTNGSQRQPQKSPVLDDEKKDQAQVVLRVPTPLKNKWVRASQAEGRKLTEWLVERIERPGPD